MMVLTISSLLAVAVAYFLYAPFTTRQHNLIGSDHPSADRDERNQQMLRDLELDMAMGKLSDKEYQVLQRSFDRSQT